MWGAVVGDIVGSIYEFDNLKTKEGWPLFRDDSRYTDDTICTTAVADAILNQHPPAQTMRKWCSRYRNAGYGENFAEWIDDPSQQAYASWGNGAAMRISPVAMLASSRKEAHKIAQRVTEITHNHKDSFAGAWATVDAILMFRTGALPSAVAERITADYGYDLSPTVDEIRPTHQFDVRCKTTVPVALICALEATDFEDALRNAISIGGDSDTIACITGAIAEARFGGVPTPILNNARERVPEDVKSIIDKLYETEPNRKSPQKLPFYQNLMRRMRDAITTNRFAEEATKLRIELARGDIPAL